MAERNWGLIRSGATFERLVAALVYFEDPRAALFGRPGPDNARICGRGMDVLSIKASFMSGRSGARL